MHPSLEQVYKAALEHADAIKLEAENIRKQAEHELDEIKEMRAQAEQKGEQAANAYFQERQQQFEEAAQTALMRRLVRKHLEHGQSPADIAHWLEVSTDFIEQIEAVLQRLNHTKPMDKPTGNPLLRYSDMGRGGTVYYENGDTKLDCWWEYGGGDALVIMDVPTPEQWEQRTKLPLAARESTLHYISTQVLKSKNGGNGSFVIGENVVTFFR